MTTVTSHDAIGACNVLFCCIRAIADFTGEDPCSYEYCLQHQSEAGQQVNKLKEEIKLMKRFTHPNIHYQVSRVSTSIGHVETPTLTLTAHTNTHMSSAKQPHMWPWFYVSMSAKISGSFTAHNRLMQFL